MALTALTVLLSFFVYTVCVLKYVSGLSVWLLISGKREAESGGFDGKDYSGLSELEGCTEATAETVDI